MYYTVISLVTTDFIYYFFWQHALFIYLFFLLNSLGWPWLTKLYRFQVPNSTTHRLYTVLCVHPKSSLLPTPCIPLSPSSTSLHLPPLGNDHMVVHIHEFFLSFFLSPSTAHHPPIAASLLSAYGSVSILLIGPFCSLDSTYEWNDMIIVFLWIAYFT